MLVTTVAAIVVVVAKPFDINTSAVFTLKFRIHTFAASFIEIVGSHKGLWMS